MKREPEHEPAPEASRSSVGRGRTRSQDAGPTSPSEEPLSNEPSATMSCTAMRERVLRVVTDQAITYARSVQASDRQSPISKHHPDAWALSLPQDPAEQRAWAQAQPEQLAEMMVSTIQGGRFLLARGVLTLQDRAGWSATEGRHTDLRQTYGQNTWVQSELSRMARRALPRYLSEREDLEEEWPRDLDPENLWLVGCSDLAGDQLMLVQGSQEAVLMGTRGLIPARTASGRRSLIAINTVCQTLRELEAGILVQPPECASESSCYPSSLCCQDSLDAAVVE